MTDRYYRRRTRRHSESRKNSTARAIKRKISRTFDLIVWFALIMAFILIMQSCGPK